jgi:hypothetical protein
MAFGYLPVLLGANWAVYLALPNKAVLVGYV